MTTIPLTPVSGSSLISHDGWNDTKTILAVRFHSSPSKDYEYRGLSPAVYEAYQSAPSKGKYLKGTLEKSGIRGTAV